MSCFVYILSSDSLDLYYIGCSNDPESRLQKHLANHNGFTSRAKDWKIRYKEEFNSKSEALKREKQLKRWKNKALIADLIKQFDG